MNDGTSPFCNSRSKEVVGANISFLGFSFQEEQIMYPSSLENEKFTVALVKGHGIMDNESVSWEITRAVKYE